MEITPHVNLLRSLRGDRVDYVLLAGEGIDNSLDAAATRVDITINFDSVTIRDNGSGITKDRLSALFSLGEHGGLSTTQLGRFGVGIKTQAVNAGDVFGVISTSRDGRFRSVVSWPDLLNSNTWEIEDPRWEPSLIDDATGTTITISQLRSRPRITIDKITNEIAQRFYPALIAGKQIWLNNIPIGILSDPEMTDIIERQLSLSDGRSAHLHAGILTAPSPLSRVHIAYRHRVIMPACSLGCGDYGGLNQMFARLDLAGPWNFGRFKNELTHEEQRDELESATLEALTPILEKCNSASMTAKLSDMTERINDLVPDELAIRRPKHLRKPEESCAQKRTRRPGFVHQDKSDPNGPAGNYKQKPNKSRLMITFDGDDDEVGVGILRAGGKIHRVELAKDNPLIADLLEHRDQKMAARSLLVIALLIFEHERAGREPQLPFEEFGKRVAKHLLAEDNDAIQHAES